MKKDISIRFKHFSKQDLYSYNLHIEEAINSVSALDESISTNIENNGTSITQSKNVKSSEIQGVNNINDVIDDDEYIVNEDENPFTNAEDADWDKDI